MWDAIQFILLLTAYIGASYFIIRLVKKYTADTNKYFRLLILSFAYALFWGLGIAGSGGEPGFALPAPNIVALGLMTSIGFYQGLLTGLIILSFWWTIIFIVMLVRQIIKDKKVRKEDLQQQL
jgi:hypothetical protein